MIHFMNRDIKMLKKRKIPCCWAAIWKLQRAVLLEVWLTVFVILCFRFDAVLFLLFCSVVVIIIVVLKCSSCIYAYYRRQHFWIDGMISSLCNVSTLCKFYSHRTMSFQPYFQNQTNKICVKRNTIITSVEATRIVIALYSVIRRRGRRRKEEEEIFHEAFPVLNGTQTPFPQTLSKLNKMSAILYLGGIG